MRRQLDLLIKNPLRCFVAVSLVLPVLAGIISLVTWTPLPWKGWSFLTLNGLGLGAWIGFTIWIKNRATHLSWSAVFGLMLQALFAIVFLGTWIAIATGHLKPTSGPFPTVGLLAIASIFLMAAFGVVFDWWWAYFLEAAILLLVGVAVVQTNSLPKLFPIGPFTWLKWVNLILFIGMILGGLQTNLSRGRQLFRVRKRPLVQLD